MAMSDTEAIAVAADYARQAAAAAAKLKPGTYDAVQALALTSLAHSMVVLAKSRVDQ